MNTALITNDAIVLGLLCLILAAIFKSSESPRFKKFYSIIPVLLLIYFIPGILNSLNIISGEHSKLYFVSSRYLLPACLVLLTLSVDLKGLFSLGNKAVLMCVAGTLGVIIGAPIAFLITYKLFPDFAGDGPNSLWRGMTTIAGSWIGGGANQAAMKEVFGAGDRIFSIMVAVDVIVANIWMGFLLFMVPRAERWNRFFKADVTTMNKLKHHLTSQEDENKKQPSLADYMLIIGIAFGVTGFSHFIADHLAPFIEETAPELAKFSFTSKFFWIIVISTAIGVLLSLTKARKLESLGTSKVASVFLYILVASIGMKMNIGAFFSNLNLFLLGGIWILIHGLILLLFAWITKSPFFLFAIGSQANIGGAASAPVVASAFHPKLAPVGVLMAVLGYVLGTYGGWLTGQLLRMAANL